jgi:capsular polysaccharide export protein
MRRAIWQNYEIDLIDPPAHWGDMRQHVFYGAALPFLRHGDEPPLPQFPPPPRLQQSRTEFKPLPETACAAMPFHGARTQRGKLAHPQCGVPYHRGAFAAWSMTASFQDAFARLPAMTDFLEVAIFDGFARRGRTRHHHLVFKGAPIGGWAHGAARHNPRG